MNPLTDQQVQQIDRFLERRGVQFIDVRYELTDHFAEAVILKLEAYPYVTFETALYAVYRDFGRTGLIEIMDQQEAALTKYWKGRVISFMKDFFKLPQILITILLSIILSTILYKFTYGFFSTYLVFVIGSWYYVWKQWKDPVLKDLVKHENLLPVKAYRKWVEVGSMMNAIFYTYILFGPLNNPHTFNIYFSIIVGILLALLYIYFAASIFVFPYWLKAEIEEKYCGLKWKV